MRQAVIGRELNALGIDHDEAHLTGCRAHEQGHDHGVDHDGLARARGPRDEHVRHLRDVGDDGLACGVATDGYLKRTSGGVGQHITQMNVLTGLVGYLDTHKRCAGDGCEDTDLLGSERECDVVLEGADLVHTLSLAHLDPKRRDEGTRDVVDDLTRKAKLLERPLKACHGVIKLVLTARARGAVGI